MKNIIRKNRVYRSAVAFGILCIISGCKAADEDTKPLTEYTDSTPPTIKTVTPVDGANIIQGSGFTITFSEPMDTDSVTVNTVNSDCTGVIQLSADSFSTCVQMASAPTWDDTKTIATVTPPNGLSRGDTYRLKITAQAEDVSGVSMNSEYSNTTGVTVLYAVQVSAGGYHTCSLLNSGSVYCWGYGFYGQLGNDSSSDHASPVQVPGIRTASYISAGFHHTCAVLDDKTVRCWGKNDSGQLGNGNTSTTQFQPAVVQDLSSASQITTGWGHSCAMLEDRTVWCWGDNTYGQLGCSGCGDQSSTPSQVSGINSAEAIDAGEFHTCALLSDTTLRCWGLGQSGQLGNGDTSDQTIPVAVSGITNAAGIAAGYRHTCTLLSDQTVKCWGNNSFGQLGNGSTTSLLVPGAVSGITTAEKLSVFNNHSCIRLTDSSMSCWGLGEQSQLGNGDTSNKTAPTTVGGLTTVLNIDAGARHTCALMQNQEVKCWGDGIMGQLGNDATSDQATPVNVKGL